MFQRTPAWGLYLRHVEGIALENITFIARKRDYRPAIVLDDAHHVNMSKMKIQEPGKKKQQIHVYQSTNITK